MERSICNFFFYYLPTMNKIILLISLILGNFGTVLCQQTITYTTDDFASNKRLIHKVISSDMIADPTNLYLLDTLLIIKHKNNPILFDVLTLKEEKIIASFGIEGINPGELIAPASIDYLPKTDELLVYDVTMKVLNYYSLSAIVHQKNNYFINLIAVKECYPVRVYHENDTLFAALIGNEAGNSFAVLNSEAKCIETFGMFPELNLPYKKIMASALFSNYAEFYKDYIVNTYNYWDKIEIYKNKKLSVILNGPSYQKFNVVSNNNNIVMSDENNNAFGKPCLSNNFFLVAYDGSDYYKSHGADWIFKFDYEGKLLCKYKLDIPIAKHSIVADWDNNFVYAIANKPEPVIVRFDL